MYLAGVPVQDHTSLLSVVVVGVMVTIEPEVGAVPRTVITPVLPTVATLIMPVAEMVMAEVQAADQEPKVCMPSARPVLAEEPARISSETRARTV